ncbi:MAG: phosphatidylcholine/phosphatidylserine synthase [Ferruginibacter sp.]
MKQIPNIFTLLNLFFGCIAIVFTLQTQSVLINVNEDFSSSFNIPEQLAYASIFILIAGLVDFLDGFVARMFNATSEMGKQLDSLADVVSFGVAPAMIMYQLLRFSYMREEHGLDTSTLYLFPAFLIACAGAYRLARFNLDKSQSTVFKGLPIPANGILIASFPLLLHYGNSMVDVNELFSNKWFLYAVIFIVCFLMVSIIPMMSLKFKNLSVKDNLPKLILVTMAIVAALLFHWLAVPIVFITYIILSLIFKQEYR